MLMIRPGTHQSADGSTQQTSQFGQAVFSGRPLPRRESSVRSDYQVLDGINRHIILSNGWIHEQENYKRAISDKGADSFIAKEIGINRYQRIEGHDFSSGDAYFKRTERYWKAVRDTWDSLFKKHNSLTLRGGSSGKFEAHFNYADSLSGEVSKEAVNRAARDNVISHIASPPGSN